MTQPFVPPELNKSAFHCPSCHAYANQLWGDAYAPFSGGGFTELTGVTFARCTHCQEESIWGGFKLIYPALTLAAPANYDLPDDIKTDYNETSSIVSSSPRGAAALLRLCIQKLCKHLGGSGKNINDDIAQFVKQ